MSLTPKNVILAELAYSAFKYEATPEEVKRWKISVDTATGEHFIHTCVDVKVKIARGNYIVKDFWGNVEVITEEQYKDRFKEV